MQSVTINRLFEDYSLVVAWAIILASAILAAAALSLGASSDFIFDDIPNLSPLTEVGQQSLFSSQFWGFVFSGFSGPTGRPISLFTFALQAEHWPTNPAAFKATNIALHCLNGIVLLLIAVQILKLKANKNPLVLISIALLIAVWVLHPIHTSTILLAVQRMTLLSSFFVLCASYGFLRGRELVSLGDSKHGIIIIILSQGFFGICAVLSKESGVLLLLYLLILETVIFSSEKNNPWILWWKRLFIYLPLLAIVAYFTVRFEQAIIGSYEIRDFNLLERLMTEARILWVYVWNIWVPDVSKFGLAAEIPLSKSLLSPYTTLISIVACSMALGASVFFRKVAWLFSLAIFWFLAGHALESTFIGLELYFDHRNYLASMGVIGIGFLVFWTVLEKLTQSKKLIVVLLVVSIFACAVITARVAILWQDPVTQARTWMQKYPHSIRAKEFLASSYFSREDFSSSIKIYQNLARSEYSGLNSVFFWLHISCLSKQYDAPDLELFEKKMTHSKRFFEHSDVLDSLTQSFMLGQCQQDFKKQYIQILYSALEYEKFESNHGILSFNLAKLLANQGDIELASTHFEKAFELTKNPAVLFVYGVFLMNADEPERALASFSRAKKQLMNQVIVDQEKVDMVTKAMLQLEDSGN